MSELSYSHTLGPIPPHAEIVEIPPIRWNSETGKLEYAVRTFGRYEGSKWVEVPTFTPLPKGPSDE